MARALKKGKKKEHKTLLELSFKEVNANDLDEILALNLGDIGLGKTTNKNGNEIY